MPEQEVVETPEVEVPATETSAVSETAHMETDQEEKKKGGFQRRIDKLTAERYRLEGELKAYREREAAAQAKPAQAEAKTADADPEPKQDDFATYELWVKAQARWEARQVAREEVQTLTAKQEKEYEAAELEERDRQVVEAYQGNVKAFAAEHDDFDEVVGTIAMRKAVGEAVQIAIMEEPAGPQIAYYLGQHPELCQQLNDLSPAAAVAKIGRLAERLAPELSDEEEAEEEESPKPQPKRAKLPAPIVPTRKTAATDSGMSDSQSTEEWAKRFKKKMGYEK